MTEAPPDGTDPGPIRRTIRAAGAPAARRARVFLQGGKGAPVVEPDPGPSVEDVDRQVGELGERLDQLAAEHAVVAEDLRNLHLWIDEHAASIDPGTGDHPIVNRLRELSGDLHSLERRYRDVVRREAGALAERPANGDAPAPSSRPSLDQLIGYDAFEQRFRGGTEAITQEQVARYGDLLRGHSPVVDIGCGRGELLQVLRDRGTHVLGVEPSATMAAAARAAGLEIHEQLGGDYLRTVEDRSLGAIISLQVVEHLEVEDLLELLDLAAAKLRPGGLFIVETPNPASWIVMHTSFILDPTHVWPLNPALLSFFCERAGFEEVAVEYFAPATSMHLPLVDDPEAPPWAATINEALGQLNDVLFGPQDYAVIARAPGGRSAPA